MRDVLRAGADKVSLNTRAVADPALITACAARFGSQAVVVAIDARAVPFDADRPSGFEVVVKGGRESTGLDAIDWAARAVELGAGELLVTSIDRDGTKSGFDTPLLRAITSRVGVPVIASGGASGPADFVTAVVDGGADAVLAAGIFHRGEATIGEVKAAMAAAGLPVRAVRQRASRMTAITPGPVDLASSLEPVAVAWGAEGLVAGVVQDVADGRVLMVGWLDAEALAATLATGEVHFHSRSRGTLWRKGETSGNVLRLHSLAVDCDGDALLLGVEPAGPTCHRETRSCFDADGETVTAGGRPQGFAWLESLWSTIAAPSGGPARGLVHRHAARRRRGSRGPQGRRGGDRGAPRGQERRGRAERRSTA